MELTHLQKSQTYLTYLIWSPLALRDPGLPVAALDYEFPNLATKGVRVHCNPYDCRLADKDATIGIVP